MTAEPTEPDFNGTADFEQILAVEHARRQPPKKLPPMEAVTREFRKIDEDRYVMTIPTFGTTIELDRVQWSHGSLTGMLQVRSTHPGARVVFDNVILGSAEFNISGPTGRNQRAKVVAERTGAKGFDWPGVFEELCHRVLAADRDGRKAELLERPDGDDEEDAMVNGGRLDAATRSRGDLVRGWRRRQIPPRAQGAR